MSYLHLRLVSTVSRRRDSKINTIHIYKIIKLKNTGKYIFAGVLKNMHVKRAIGGLFVDIWRNRK